MNLLTGINEKAAKELIFSYISPARNILLWAIPFGCAIACLVTVVQWLAKSDEEKEREKPGRTIKKIVFWSIVAESIMAILAIFGLS